MGSVKGVPYAEFRYQDEVYQLTEFQFTEAVKVGRQCRCNTCLCCRAVEYHDEVRRKI